MVLYLSIVALFNGDTDSCIVYKHGIDAYERKSQMEASVLYMSHTWKILLLLKCVLTKC